MVQRAWRNVVREPVEVDMGVAGTSDEDVEVGEAEDGLVEGSERVG
jgi:hypothetical protein